MRAEYQDAGLRGFSACGQEALRKTKSIIANMQKENIMTINKNREGSKMTVALEGRLDTTTAPKLEGEIRGSLDGVTDLEFDFQNLAYISSAGLRVMLSAQKVMNKQGNMTICNVNEDIMEVFEVTGFVDILNIV